MPGATIVLPSYICELHSDVTPSTMHILDASKLSAQIEDTRISYRTALLESILLEILLRKVTAFELAWLEQIDVNAERLSYHRLETYESMASLHQKCTRTTHPLRVAASKMVVKKAASIIVSLVKHKQNPSRRATRSI